MMSERPERKSDFRSGPLRSEVELQSKLNVAGVDGSSHRSEVAGAHGEGCATEPAQNEVCAVEDVKEVRLEHQVHTFPGQFEVLAQRKVRRKEVRADDAANAARTRTCPRRGRKSKRIKELTGSSWSKRYSRNHIRAPHVHVHATNQLPVHDRATKRSIGQNRNRLPGL